MDVVNAQTLGQIIGSVLEGVMEKLKITPPPSFGSMIEDLENRRVQGTLNGPPPSSPPGVFPHDPTDIIPVPKGFKPNLKARRSNVAPGETAITHALEDYVEEHAHRSPVFAAQVERVFEDMLLVVGLGPFQAVKLITKPLVRRWKDKLMASKAGASTVARKLAMADHFFKWCLRQDYVTVIPTAGLELPARLVADSKRRKKAFTPEDLRVMLNDPYLTERRTATTAKGKLSPRAQGHREWYWAVMMLAYTGARAGEILHLHRSDIRQEPGTGIWWINIEKDLEQHKRVKNRFSIRQVPIHSTLLAFGFLEFAQGGKSTVLFPRIRESVYPVGLVSTGFRYWREEILLKGAAPDRSKSLHSLRHSMAQALARARVDPSVRHRIMGHAQGTSVEDRIYLDSMEFSLTELSEGLEKIVMPLEPPAAPLVREVAS